MDVLHMCAWYWRTSEEDIGSPEAGGMDGFKLSCGCWELNMSPLQEQQVLLTTLTHLSGPRTQCFEKL